MSRQATELEVLQQAAHELQADGYEVFLHPRRRLLPDFLGDFMPDAIALRSDKNLAIEVGYKSKDRERRIQKTASLFEGQDEWEFRVIWIAPTDTLVTLHSQTPSLIRTRIAEVRELTKGKHLGAAFLLAWAALEAVGRTLLPQKFERPQTPRRLVQVLASEGYLTPTEADSMRQLSEKRNRLIHGELKTRITESNVSQMVGVLSMLTKLAHKQPED